MINMNNKAMSFLSTTAGTPVDLSEDRIGFNVQSAKSVLPYKKIQSIDWAAIDKKSFAFCRKFTKSCSALLWSSIILVVLAHIAPELREEIPSLYRLVDFILKCVEWLYSTFWLLVESIF